MRQLADVHMLPTDKSCNLYEIAGTLISSVVNKKYQKGFELYFTNDEEIKEPCWVIMTNQHGEKKLLYVEHIPDNPKYLDIRGGYALFREICKKIVATTNPELWTREGSKETYHIFTGMGSIPESFIKAYISAYNAGSPIKQVMLEYIQYGWKSEKTGVWKEYTDEFEFVKQDRFLCNNILKLNPNGSVIWSLKEEKMYPKPETGSLFSKAKSFSTGAWINTKDFNEWFDRNYPQ